MYGGGVFIFINTMQLGSASPASTKVVMTQRPPVSLEFGVLLSLENRRSTSSGARGVTGMARLGFGV